MFCVYEQVAGRQANLIIVMQADYRIKLSVVVGCTLYKLNFFVFSYVYVRSLTIPFLVYS